MDPSKLSFTILCIHSPMQRFEKALVYFDTTVSYTCSISIKLTPVANVVNFYGRNYICNVISLNVCHCQSLRPQSKISKKARSHPQEQSPIRGFVQVGSSLVTEHQARVEVNYSNKHSSLLRCRIYYPREKEALQPSAHDQLDGKEGKTLQLIPLQRKLH